MTMSLLCLLFIYFFYSVCCINVVTGVNVVVYSDCCPEGGRGVSLEYLLNELSDDDLSSGSW